MTQAELQAALDGLTDEQLAGALDETPTDNDPLWQQYLNPPPTTSNSNSFFSKYGIAIAAIGVFALVLFLLNRKK